MIARRYLRSKYKPPVLRLVTFLSIAGVAAGVATLVIALAMNTGSSLAIRNRLLGVTAHVNIKPNGTQGNPKLSRSNGASGLDARRGIYYSRGIQPSALVGGQPNGRRSSEGN